MLGIADEDGWVQILDSRKTGHRSIIKGKKYCSAMFLAEMYLMNM